MTSWSIKHQFPKLNHLINRTLIGITGLLVFTIFLSSCSIINPPSFEMMGGDEQVLVLLRSEEDGTYQVRYEGRDQTELRSLKVMLGGQILHVDIHRVTLLHDGREILLEGDGTLPEGTQVVLSPGEEFDVKVTYLGQTLGGNYMYGFRIGYGNDPGAEPYDLIAEYDYAIIVE